MPVRRRVDADDRRDVRVLGGDRDLEPDASAASYFFAAAAIAGAAAVNWPARDLQLAGVTGTPWILRHPGRLIVTGAVGSAVGVGISAYAVWRTISLRKGVAGVTGMAEAAAFVGPPEDVESLYEELFEQAETVVLTSATLATRSGFGTAAVTYSDDSRAEFNRPNQASGSANASPMTRPSRRWAHSQK